LPCNYNHFLGSLVLGGHIYLLGVGVDDAMVGYVKSNIADGRARLKAVESFIKMFIVGCELYNLIKGSSCEEKGHVEAILYTLL
jgi:hypothetical protein